MKNKNKNQSKDIVAVLITCFIVISLTHYAHSADKNYDERTTRDTSKNSEHTSGNDTALQEVCLTTGTGTGRIESYCADTSEHLIEAIRSDWSENPEKTKPKIDPQQKPRSSKYQRKASNPEIEAIIRAEAERQGYDNPELAIDIADCESRLNPNAKNIRGNTPSWSVDEGLWQYNNHWQRKNITSECAYDAMCSTRQAIKDLKTGKASQWVCYGIVTR